MLRAISVVLVGYIILTAASHGVSTAGSNAHCQAIEAIIQKINQFKPGIPRGQLEKDLELDGGMQFAQRSRYLLKECRYVKVDVEFSGEGIEHRAELLPTDKVVKISKPFLDYPTTD